jgi:chromosomal replication initiator protein
MTPAPPQLAHDWTRIEAALRRAVSDATYDLWLGALHPRALTEGTLFLGAPEQIRSWVADRFGSVLDACAAEVLGPGTVVRVTGRHDPLPDVEPDRPSLAPHGRDAAIDLFSPKLTFGQFVIGDGNRFAHAAALAVAEMPGQAYNPLFLYGPPGVGKTHLLHSIGNYLTSFGGGLQVQYVTAERFTNEFVAALHGGSIEDFKARFRHIDVLLVDDVQFLQAKARTEEEFFHTFNALYDAGSQLVLTCDRLPNDLEALEDRLLERFRAGLVADVRSPDHATRKAILAKRVDHDGIVLADEHALDVIADRITDDARTLEGALIRVVAFHSLTGRALDAALAAEVLDQLYPHSGGSGRAPTIARVQELTCEAFGIDREQLLGSGRTAAIAWARQVAMFLAREHTGASLPAIGRDFGGRNHTTVMHACRRAGERIAASPEDRDLVHRLQRRLSDDA